jgi:hypothetical protein
MCKLRKVFQQSFRFYGSGTPTSVKHNFRRVYKTHTHQYFKVKCIYVSSTQPLLLTHFPHINTNCNYIQTNNSQTIGSSNHFFLGCATSNHVPEMIVDEIPLADFEVQRTVSTDTLSEYILVFQIELWEP